MSSLGRLGRGFGSCLGDFGFVDFLGGFGFRFCNVFFVGVGGYVCK